MRDICVPPLEDLDPEVKHGGLSVELCAVHRSLWLFG
jgi:hypothetical protein